MHLVLSMLRPAKKTVIAVLSTTVQW